APNSAGIHSIKCIVSDGKGGSAEKSISIKVEIEDAGSINISADLTIPHSEGFKITRALVKISGDGNEDGLEMNLSASKAALTLSDIPSGEHEMVIEAYQYQTLIYK